MDKKKNPEWWSPGYGFFGKFYMEGDNSREGYLEKKHLTIQERTKEDVKGVIRLLGLKGGEKILDIPCGYGRHSIELAKRGFCVAGSDINPVHLKAAKRKPEESSSEYHSEKKIFYH